MDENSSTMWIHSMKGLAGINCAMSSLTDQIHGTSE